MAKVKGHGEISSHGSQTQNYQVHLCFMYASFTKLPSTKEENLVLITSTFSEESMSCILIDFYHLIRGIFHSFLYLRTCISFQTVYFTWNYVHFYYIHSLPGTHPVHTNDLQKVHIELFVLMVTYTGKLTSQLIYSMYISNDDERNVKNMDLYI